MEAVVSLLERGAGRGTNRVELATNKDVIGKEKETFGEETIEDDAVVYRTLLRMTLLLLRDVFDLENGVSCDYLSRKECAGLVLIETIEKLIREGGPFSNHWSIVCRIYRC